MKGMFPFPSQCGKGLCGATQEGQRAVRAVDGNVVPQGIAHRLCLPKNPEHLWRTMNNKSRKIIDSRRIPGSGLPETCGSILPLLSCQAKTGHLTLPSGPDTSPPPHPAPSHTSDPQIPQILRPPDPNWDRLSQAAPGHMMTVPSSLLVPWRDQPAPGEQHHCPGSLTWKTQPHPHGRRGEGAQTMSHCWDFLLGKELWHN